MSLGASVKNPCFLPEDITIPPNVSEKLVQEHKAYLLQYCGVTI